MARMPLTKEEVVPTKLVLNVEKIGLTEEQFLQLCRDNRDLRMELTAQKELIIMSPTGLKSGWRELFLCTALMNWATKDGTGIAIGPSAGYRQSPSCRWRRTPRPALRLHSGRAGEVSSSLSGFCGGNHVSERYVSRDPRQDGGVYRQWRSTRLAHRPLQRSCVCLPSRSRRGVSGKSHDHQRRSRPLRIRFQRRRNLVALHPSRSENRNNV